jgi:hypothetical protein
MENSTFSAATKYSNLDSDAERRGFGPRIGSRSSRSRTSHTELEPRTEFRTPQVRNVMLRCLLPYGTLDVTGTRGSCHLVAQKLLFLFFGGLITICYNSSHPFLVTFSCYNMRRKSPEAVFSHKKVGDERVRVSQLATPLKN